MSKIKLVPMDLAILRDIVENSKSGNYAIRDFRLIKLLSLKLRDRIPKPPEQPVMPAPVDSAKPTDEERKLIGEHHTAWAKIVEEYEKTEVEVEFNSIEIMILKGKLTTSKFNEQYIDAVITLCGKFGV